MATISLTAINPNDDLNAEPVDNNFNTIKNLVNGNIDNDNIKVAAAIAWSKISKSSSALNDLADINAGAPTDGQALKWDNATSKWIPGSVNTEKLATNNKAKVYLSANQTVSTGSATKLQLNTEVYDPGSNYDNATNYRFTVPTDKDGIYLVTAQTRVAIAPNLHAKIMIYKNGSNVAEAEMNGQNQQMYLRVTDLLDLVATDYIEIYVSHNHGSNRDFQGGSTLTFAVFHQLSD